MRPKLSVIITTHNRRSLLRSCLASLEHQTASLDDFEVVVVDDGSTDATVQMLVELAPAFRLSVVSQPQLGQSAARNAGASRAKGRILLFIDDDEEAAPGLVAVHLRAHRVNDRIVGVGIIQRRVPAHADRFARLRAEEVQTHNQRLTSMPVTYVDCYGGNCSVSRTIFDEVGGYAPDVGLENDFEFGYRLERAGAAFVLLPDAVVTEYYTRDWRQMVAELELRGRAAVALYYRHPAMVDKMELGGYGGWSRNWIAIQRLALTLRIPPEAMARVGFVLPRRQWARTWFRFVWDYAYWCGVKVAADRQLWRSVKRGVLILRYHAFCDTDDQRSRYVVSRRRFVQQMTLLKRGGYNILGLDEYIDYRREHRFPPAKSVVITIDDGYADAETVALPTLERLGFRATVFLVTSHDYLDQARIHPTLARRPLLDLARARRMLGTALDFGAHTQTHSDLATLKPADARREVLGSKQDLERALGVQVNNFAYPFGAATQDVRRLVERVGFRSACGVTPGRNHPATDPFDLRRIEVRGTYTLLRFGATLVLGDTSNLPFGGGLASSCTDLRTFSTAAKRFIRRSRGRERLARPVRVSVIARSN